ncbi:Hypothetical protein D9617_14g075260 [Elsinoe fawcettii]|nr:Hypothetical protein D9617_14g075260 [Elsinoe fawcettii]
MPSTSKDTERLLSQMFSNWSDLSNKQRQLRRDLYYKIHTTDRGTIKNVTKQANKTHEQARRRTSKEDVERWQVIRQEARAKIQVEEEQRRVAEAEKYAETCAWVAAAAEECRLEHELESKEEGDLNIDIKVEVAEDYHMNSEIDNTDCPYAFFEDPECPAKHRSLYNVLEGRYVDDHPQDYVQDYQVFGIVNPFTSRSGMSGSIKEED